MNGANRERNEILDYAHVFILDMELHIVFWDTRDEQIYGFSRNEAIGRVVNELLKTELPRPLDEIVSELIADGRWQGDMLHARKDGRRIPVSSYWVLYRDKSGSPSAIVAVNNDITQRRQAEAELARDLRNMELLSVTATHLLEPMPFSELFQYTADQLQAIAGGAGIVVSEYNPGMNETIVRALAGPVDKLQKATDILGRNPIGLKFKVAEGTLQRMIKGRLDYLEGGFCDLIYYQMPLSLCKSIEEELHLGAIYVMPFFLGRDFMGRVAVLTDRDEGLRNRELIEAIVNQAALALKRKRAEEALKRSQARFRATFDHAGIGMTIIDEEGTVLEANPAFAEFVGYSLPDLPGMHVRRYSYPPDLAHGDELLHEMLEGKRDSYQVEKRYVTKDGNVVWGRLTASIARNPAPEPPFIIGMIEDITERKQAEEREQKRKEEQLEFYRRTILAATEGKLVITERNEIYRIAGEPAASWSLSDPEELCVIRHNVTEIARGAGIAESRVEMFVMAVGEALTNAIKHAQGGSTTMHRLKEGLMLVITDQGPGIPSLALPDVALTRGYSTAGTLGMGYKFMITFADKVYLATGSGGTTVGLVLQLQPPEKSQLGLSPLGAMLAMEQADRMS
ncbi:MAG: PAS domain S-box protein [bacterium]|nr:PAS domain S-box protein [bacterium]